MAHDTPKKSRHWLRRRPFRRDLSAATSPDLAIRWNSEDAIIRDAYHASGKFAISATQAEWTLFDDQVYHAFGQLAGAILANPWRVGTPGQMGQIEDYPDESIAELIRVALRGIRPGAPGINGGGFADFARSITKAYVLGHVHLNLTWGEAEELPGSFVPIEYRRLSNEKIRAGARDLTYEDPNGQRFDLLGSNIEDPVEAAIHRRRFLNVTWGGEGHPLGFAVARVIYWIVSLRRDTGIANWSQGLNRYGLPAIKVTLEGEPSEEDFDNAIAEAERMRNSLVFAMGDGDAIELSDSVAKWTPDSFEKFVQFSDRAIDKVILGQSGTSGEEGTAVGSFARNKVLENVRQDIVETVADWLGSVLAGLAEEIVAENADLLGIPLDPETGKAVGLAPIVIDFIFPDSEATARREKKQTALQATYDRGISVSRSQWYREHDLDDPEPNADDVLIKPEPAAGGSIPGLPFSTRRGAIHAFQSDNKQEPENVRIVADFIPVSAAAHAEEARRAYAPMIDRLEKAIRSIRPADWTAGPDASKARFLEQLSPRSEAGEAFQTAIQNGIVHGDMIGRHAVDYSRIVTLEEMKRKGRKAAIFASEDDVRAEFLRQLGIYSRMSDDGLLGEDAFFLAPEQIARIFSNAQIVSPADWLATLERSDRWAFFVRGLETEAQEAAVLRLLDRAHAQGQGLRDFVQAARPKLDGALSDARLETIFRTNMQQANAVGEWDRMNSETVLQATKYWRYFNPDDSRSRPAHAALNGFMVPPDDPAWAEINPPNGYNCRCGKRVIWQDEPLARRNPTPFPEIDGQRVSADPGFQQNTAAILAEGRPGQVANALT